MSIEEVKAAVTAKLEAGIGAMAAQLEDAIREKVSEHFPPASEPGEPPHERTNYADTITTEQSGTEARVGSDSPHALFLEIGTERMAARPHIVPTVTEQAGEMQRAFAEAVT